MARGLAAVLPADNLTIVVNVGDDDLMYGVLVCADLDTVTYTLAGIEGPHGWGVAGDTHVVMKHLESMGVATDFRLGDRDLAHCLARTAFLAAGGSLTAFTREATQRLGIGCTVLPASDDRIRTRIVTPTGEELAFQDYFVTRGQSDRVSALRYEGASRAVAAPGVVAAIEGADLVVVAPSNPPLSIAPILAIADIAAALAAKPSVIAVSPLIGGKAVKGPLVAVMEGLGLEPSNRGIADQYRGLISHLIIDTSDERDLAGLGETGLAVETAPTLIGDTAAAAALATRILGLATSGIGDR